MVLRQVLLPGLLHLGVHAPDRGEANHYQHPNLSVDSSGCCILMVVQRTDTGRDVGALPRPAYCVCLALGLIDLSTASFPP